MKIDKSKCKDYLDKWLKCMKENYNTKYRGCMCYLENVEVKSKLFKFKCRKCNENQWKKFNEALKNWFSNTYTFCNLDISKFILMLWKGVFLHAYIDGWEKFNGPSLPEKKGFSSNLNIEHITVTRL